MKKRNNIKGFTLIELIVVITIIGLISTIGALSYANTIKDAQIAKSKQDMNDFIQALETARIKTGKTANAITGSGCSDCACRLPANKVYRDIPTTDTCYVNWINVLTKISSAGVVDISAFTRDPWGSPYLFDENEKEYNTAANCNPARIDRIKSAGPYGIMSTSDDIGISIPLFLEYTTPIVCPVS